MCTSTTSSLTSSAISTSNRRSLSGRILVRSLMVSCTDPGTAKAISQRKHQNCPGQCLNYCEQQPGGLRRSSSGRRIVTEVGCDRTLYIRRMDADIIGMVCCHTCFKAECGVRLLFCLSIYVNDPIDRPRDATNAGAWK